MHAKTDKEQGRVRHSSGSCDVEANVSSYQIVSCLVTNSHLSWENVIVLWHSSPSLAARPLYQEVNGREAVLQTDIMPGRDSAARSMGK
jgi:hypothetical protein